MSVPNALREDNEGYFLEQDVDVAAWLTKVIERATYMALREQEKAPYKGKKPVTANRQSKPSVHAPTPAKTGESSWQRLDADLESYGQAREQVLPYDEAPLSGGANSTLYDESTMDIDQIVGDIYRDC
ncbi:hypothetical protein M422DRAFT_270442 [Sphaerobolus stellatus SS14]|uniref:Uncharacterized protein n=1 Tax=Sphaerobolus stellatus (strain SS14) TaxID=990650 RepID=A0A0C9TFX7_SPHS4|nr:hypothetical protein M422DRAFT_270442 [Sphaerobolus stellatus SS14]